MEQICPVDTLATQLGVEHESAAGEAATAENLIYGQAHLVDGVRELVGVPTVLHVAAVRIDGSKDPVVHGVGDLVFERVA